MATEQRGPSVVVLVMIGLPAAGKSTLAGRLQTAAAAELAVHAAIKPRQPVSNTAASAAATCDDDGAIGGKLARVFGRVRLLAIDDVVYDPEIHTAAPPTTTAAPTASSSTDVKNGSGGGYGDDDDDDGLTWRQQRQVVLHTLKSWLDELVPISAPTHTPPPPQERTGGGGDLGSDLYTLVVDDLVPISAPTDTPPPLQERSGGGGELGSDLYTFVVDDNMYYSSMRYQVYQLVRQYSVGFAQVLLECPADTAVARDRARLLSVGEAVIRRMATRFEAPSPASNSWERHSATVSSANADSPEGAARMLRGVVAAARADPTAPVVQIDLEALHLSRQVNAASAKRQFDASTRKIMTAAMAVFAKAGPTKAASKLYAMRLTKIRKQMLKDFRVDGANVAATDIAAKIEAFELETTVKSN